MNVVTTASKKINRLYNKIKVAGLGSSVVDITALLYDHYFDFKYGLDTYTWVSKEELSKENEEVAANAVLYQAIKVIPLRKLFKKLDLKKDQAFIDFGSGKGRVLLLASRLGYKKIKGVEFSKSLCTIAENNIAKYKKQIKVDSTFEVINMDASIYPFEGDECTIFMYNPFYKPVMDKVLKNLQESLEAHQRNVTIIYANPGKNSLIDGAIKTKSKEVYKIWNFDFIVYNL